MRAVLAAFGKFVLKLELSDEDINALSDFASDETQEAGARLQARMIVNAPDKQAPELRGLIFHAMR